jgi:hypothetical protein
MPLWRTAWSSKIAFSVTSALADTTANKIAAKPNDIFMILIPFILFIPFIVIISLVAVFGRDGV